MKRQFLVLVIPVVLLLVVLISCGGEKSTSAPAQSSPLELLKKSIERGKEIQSVRAVADIQFRVPGGDSITTVMTLEKAKNGRTSRDSAIYAAGADLSYKMITAEPDLYVNVLDGGWYRANRQEAERVLWGDLFNPHLLNVTKVFPPGDIPWELYKVERLDPERIDGVMTDHLRIHFDFREVWTRLSEQDKQRYAQSFGGTLKDWEETYSSADFKNYEVWIDNDGNIRRELLEFRSVAVDFYNTDVRMSDFNKPINIELPKTYEEGLPPLLKEGLRPR